MRSLLLATLLWPSSAPGLYDPQPNHLWNRIHAAIHGWQFAHHPESPDPDSLHWPAGLDVMDERSQLRLTPLLEEFLSKKGESLVADPLKRAVLQRDLWMIFEWSVHTERGGEAWDVVKNDRVEIDKGKHRELRKNLVAVMRKLALSPEQIRVLPDTLAAAAKAFPVKGEAKPGDVYVPSDLLDLKGPWVVMGNAAGGPLAIAHHQFFEGRAFFAIFLKMPGGRKATEEYIKKLGDVPFSTMNSAPECPPGTQVVLLRKSLLLSEQGYPILSPITESFQLRYLGHPFEEWKESHSIKLQLKREKLFAGEGGGLVLPGPKDVSATRVLLLGHAKEDGYTSIVKSCRHCHVGAAITSLEVVFPIRRRLRAVLKPTTLEDEEWESSRWTLDRYSFGLLRAQWPD